MDVHVSLVGETSRGYTNMMKLLLYSLRANGGKLSDAPVTVSTNADAMDEADRQEIEQFGPVTVRVMPRQHGEHFADKFNALYAAPEDVDVLVYLDCDTVVLNPLDGMVEGIEPGKPHFRARPIGAPGARCAGPVEALIEEYALPEGRSVDDVRDERFPRGFPLFNGGVMVMTQPAREAVRRDASKIAFDLYARRAQTAVASLPDIIKEIGHRIVDRFLPSRERATYEYWVAEQLGVAFSLMRNDIPYDLLDPRYNWVFADGPDESSDDSGDALPSLFHYMKGRHPVDREHLFDGDWIDDFRASDSPTRRALATLADRYREQHEPLPATG